jgi:hypothetical protein
VTADIEVMKACALELAETKWEEALVVMAR